MMEEEEYTEPQELLEFVMTECGDMKFISSYCDIDGVYYTGYSSTKKNIYRKIRMRSSDFDTERFFYACDLLKKEFDETVIALSLMRNTVIEEGWLDKTELKIISIPSGTKLPDLPKSITKIQLKADVGIRFFMSENIGYFGNKYWSVRCDKSLTDEHKFDSQEEALEYLKNSVNDYGI